MDVQQLAVARDAFAITPSDTAFLPATANGLYIGSVAGGATLTVVTIAGNQVTFSAVVAGSTIPLAVKQVLNTGTLASSIVGLK